MITLYKWGRKALVAQVITYNGEHFLPNSALRMLVGDYGDWRHH